MKKLFLGIEIGATKNQIAIGDNKGNILHSMMEKVIVEDGAQGILNWLKKIIPVMILREKEFGGKVSAIGVGFGGIIESSTGKILISVQVKGWQDLMLKDWFEDNFKIPTTIINDTVTGGYAEYICGTGKGSEQFFYTNIGSGIGGAFFLNGKYYDGLGYGAAYFGHTYIPDWTTTKPGVERKVEDLCSGWAIEKRLRSEGYVPDNSSLMKLCGGNRSGINCSMLGEAAKKGDEFALSEIDRVAKSFGTGLANVLTLISPDCISIGGSMLKIMLLYQPKGDTKLLNVNSQMLQCLLALFFLRQN
jgi:glucokinase